MSFRLGDLVDIRGGGTPSKAVDEYWGGTIPWASVKDFKSTEISTTTDYITANAIKNSATNLIPAGSIIVPTRMALGKVAINTVEMAINQDLKALIIKDDKQIEQRYLLRFLESKSDYFEGQGKGATVKGITLDVLRELEIPLPPLAEQKRIAVILDKADAIRRKRQQAIKLADDFLRSVFLDMFGDPVSNPKGWEVKTLDDLSAKPISYGILKPEEYEVGGIPMLRIQDIKKGKIINNGLHLVSNKLSNQYKRTILDGNEIVISLVGSVGLSAIVPLSLKGANVHRNLGVIQLIDSRLTEFVASFLQMPHFEIIVDRITKGGVHKLLNLADLKQIEIPIPNMDSVILFTKVKEVIQRVSDKYNEANEPPLFTSLSQRVFSGQL